MNHLPLQKLKTRIGYPNIVAEQLYQINTTFGKSATAHGVGQLNQLVTTRKIKELRLCRANKLSALGERHIEEKGNLAKSANQLSENHDLLPHIWVASRPDSVEDA